MSNNKQKYRENMKCKLSYPDNYAKHLQTVKNIYKHNITYNIINKFRANIYNICKKFNIQSTFKDIIGCDAAALLSLLQDKYSIKAWNNITKPLNITSNIPLRLFLDKNENIETQLKFIFNCNNCKLNLFNDDFFELKYKSIDLQNQFTQYKTTTKSYITSPNQNKITYHFYHHFFNAARQFLNDKCNIDKYKQNRIKYINKQYWEMSCESILSNTKPAGLVNGYSHFSPYWIKTFLQEYNIHSIYDPCGGWGQRLLGALNSELYIYNDVWDLSVQSTKQLIKHFNLKNIAVYNCDSAILTPSESYEAIFTCPPYYNLETYNDKYTFNTLEHYKNWWKNTIQHALKPSVKYIGIVISNDLEPIITNTLVSFKFNKISVKDIGIAKHTHFVKDKQTCEYMYIYGQTKR